jgi:hypothetical protein
MNAYGVDSERTNSKMTDYYKYGKIAILVPQLLFKAQFHL